MPKHIKPRSRGGTLYNYFSSTPAPAASRSRRSPGPLLERDDNGLDVESEIAGLDEEGGLPKPEKPEICGDENVDPEIVEGFDGLGSVRNTGVQPSGSMVSGGLQSSIQTEAPHRLPFPLPEHGLSFAELRLIQNQVRPVVLEGDGYLPSYVRGFNQSQQLVWTHLRWLLKEGYLAVRPYESGCTEPFSYNEITWGRAFASLAKNLLNAPRDAGDCWFAGGKPDKWGYPDIHVTPGYVKWAAGQGYRFTADSSLGDDKRIKAAKLCWALGNPSRMGSYIRGDRECQVDHRCDRNGCINPWHLWTASDQENKNRHGCRFGSAFLCPHGLRCIFTAEDGRVLECLNSEDVAAYAVCSCVPSCKGFVSGRRSTPLA